MDVIYLFINKANIFGTMELDICLSQSLGPFVLFDSMYRIMSKLRANKMDRDITFINGTLINIIQLRRYNINLIFEAKMQKLVMIEVVLDDQGTPYLPDIFTHNGTVIKKFEFKTIYNRVFGPTYPGSLDDKSNYYLSYDGICFKFDSIDKQVSIKSEYNDDDQLIQSLSTVDKEIKCNSFVLLKNNGLSWLESAERLNSFLKIDNPYIRLQEMYDLDPEFIPLKKHDSDCAQGASPTNTILGKKKLKYVSLYSGQSSSSIEINLAIINIKDRAVKFEFARHPLNYEDFTIVIGETTLQSVIEYLGPPNDCVIKKKARKPYKYSTSESLSMYMSTMNMSMSSSLLKTSKKRGCENIREHNVKIHNYFDLGIDVIYEERINEQNDTNVVKKIIIHNNCIESMEFMKYERCNFVFDSHCDGLFINSGNTKKINNKVVGNSFMSWNSILTSLNLESEGKPIFLNRKEYEINDDFANVDMSYELVDLEQHEQISEKVNGINGNGKSINANKDANTWAFSKLYATDGAIFEILIKDNLLSNLTLF